MSPVFLLLLKLIAIAMCELIPTNNNNYKQHFLIHKHQNTLRQDVYYRNNDKSKMPIRDTSLENSIFKNMDEKNQDQSLILHSLNSANSTISNIQSSFRKQEATRNSRKGKKRRKRWSRFDSISDRHQNIVQRSELAKEGDANVLEDAKRNIKIKIDAPWAERNHESQDDVWTNKLLPEIVKGFMKKYGSSSNSKEEESSNSKEESVESSSSIQEETVINKGEEKQVLAAEVISTEVPIIKKTKHHHKPDVRSATDCDEWDKLYRTCYFDRNTGDTITFVLAFDNVLPDDQIQIYWQQEFYVRNHNSTTFVDIQPDDTMWNVVIGSNNREFRISPITESDFDRNGFIATATIRYPETEPHEPVITKIKFKIRQMATDMGFVYPGEHLIINVKSYMTLPIECCSFEWYLDGSRTDRSLPSNMKVSDTGITVEISELRMEQEGILACDVYSNRNVFLTKKRFLIKEFKKDTLMRVSANRRMERAVRLRSNQLPILKRVIRQADETAANENGEGFNADLVESTKISPEESANEPTTNSIALNSNILTGNPQTGQNNLPAAVTADNNQINDPSKADQQTESSSDSIEEFVVETGKIRARDRIEIRMSKMMADCISNRQCSNDATCHQENPQSQRFCRCFIGYRGNGLFCWEEAVGRRHAPSVYFAKKNKAVK